MQYTQTDLYDIYVQGSAVGSDEADNVMLLTSSGVRCVQVMSWKQKLSAMVASRRFEEALVHAVRLYCGDGRGDVTARAGHPSLWPSNLAADATAVSKQVLSLLLMYVEQTMGATCPADDGVGACDVDNPRTLVQLALDVCLLVDEVSSAFYRDLPPLFKRSQAVWHAYLDAVMEHCLSSSAASRALMPVPPQVIQSLVERVVESQDGCVDAQSALNRLEDVLLSFDVSSLDLNQVLPLCIRNGLYSVLICVFTRSMRDYKSPAALLFARAAAGAQGAQGADAAEASAAATSNLMASELLVYVYACFEGLAYPIGSADAQHGQTEETKTNMRLEMMEFLLFATVAQVRETVQLWTALGGAGVESEAGSDGLDRYQNMSSPVLAFLCGVDATTVLGLLRNLLSAWDGLVSDLASPLPETADVPEHTTLSQATVDRVVELLHVGEAERSKEANHAKLDFVAGLVSSNRASLPPAATLSVLTFLSRDMDTTSTRKNFVDVVAHAPVDALGDDVLDLARAAACAPAEADILLKRGAYREAIQCLLESQNVEDVRGVFACYRDIAERGGATAVAFQGDIVSEFPKLVEVDARSAAELAVDFASHQHKEIMEAFEEDSNGQFRFLDAVVTLLRERAALGADADVYEASPWILLLKGKAMSNMYIRLMCRFDPDSVLGYLKIADYDVDECLDCCRTHGLRAAQAYLLDRRGDLDGAFQMYLEDIEEINAEVLRCDGDADGDAGPARSSRREALIAKADAACDTAVSLCARVAESKYGDLVVAYVRGYVARSGGVDGVGAPGWARGLLLRLIKRVAQRASRPETIVEHVVDTFEDVPSGEMKAVLAVLLEVCSFQEQKMTLAADIARGDVGALLTSTYGRMSASYVRTHLSS